ncbi:hypothetical protein [Ruegeria meonggei]|uniref:hypothetical protein n=1 Tax=Ruegeria meonggei TaxID=1446476 RepID=UPI0036723AF4
MRDPLKLLATYRSETPQRQDGRLDCEALLALRDIFGQMKKRIFNPTLGASICGTGGDADDRAR